MPSPSEHAGPDLEEPDPEEPDDDLIDVDDWADPDDDEDHVIKAGSVDDAGDDAGGWAAGPEPEFRSPDLVVVVDTGLVIEIKHQVPVKGGEQWDLLNRMLSLVEDGRLAFPRQVSRELIELKWPDAPGAWCGAATPLLQHPSPDDAALVVVLAVAPGLVDEFADSAREKADPYVVAMAYQLAQQGNDAIVATTDVTDRPPLISVRSAAKLLGLVCWDFETFREWVLQSTPATDVST